MMLALIRGIRNNFIRCFKGYRFILGILGVIGVFILSLLDYKTEIRVIHVFTDSFQTITFLIVIMFCSLPYASSLCEDLENNYYRQELARHKLSVMILSKAVVIFFSAVLTMFIGSLIFTFLLGLRYKWGILESYSDLLLDISDMIKNNQLVLYIAVTAYKVGTLYGVLALLSTAISLFIRNKLIVYAAPAILWHLIVDISGKFQGKPLYLEIYCIFSPDYNVWNNEWLTLLWSNLVALILAMFLTVFIYIRFKRVIADG